LSFDFSAILNLFRISSFGFRISSEGGYVEHIDIESSMFVFVLATLIGLEVIKRVSPLLHTPLMSLTNAISAIAVVAAIAVIASGTTLGTVLGTIAVAAATANIVGGFWITDRMLKMFKERKH
jgi:NAD(P) transhydrogenase subunit alpha